jgi:hypothetical protein
MATIRRFSAPTEDALWQQVSTDLGQQPDLFEYRAQLLQGGYELELNIDIDLGGGFESGQATTTLTALVPGNPALRFALHEQEWVHELGKLLGLTDVELGDPALDAAFIITTNAPSALRHLLLQTPDARQMLLRYPTMRLALAPPSSEPDAPLHLTFALDAALTEPEELRAVYHLLLSLLEQITPLSPDNY